MISIDIKCFGPLPKVEEVYLLKNEMTFKEFKKEWTSFFTGSNNTFFEELEESHLTYLVNGKQVEDWYEMSDSDKVTIIYAVLGG